MLVRAPALLCRTVVGASSERVRDSESGPNSNKPASNAMSAATAPTPIRRAGSTMSQQRPKTERRTARTRSASGVGCQATSAGRPPSHASTSVCPEAGTANDAPLSTT